MKKYILSIDAGTTSSRALIFDNSGKEVGKVQHEFEQYFPNEGWVEHDPVEIWRSQKMAIQQVLSSTNISVNDIAAIGITNQRETTVVWDKATGQPVYNAIVWQDRRTAAFCEDLKSRGLESKISNKTGLLLDPYFSGSKINWILNNVSGAKERAQRGELLFGTIDSWLIWKLTNGEKHITDSSNASRTMLFDIHKRTWDDDLIQLLEIPKIMLPNIVSSSGFSAEARLEEWEISIPICGIAGDQQAALFGQLCFEKGAVKNTYGTGCFCMMNTGEKAVTSKNKMLTTIAWEINGKVEYALEGSVFIGGALIQWLRDGLELFEKTSEVEELAKSVEDNGGVTFISALTGIGAPYWNPMATGGIFGITRGTKKGHIARAALEAIAIRSMEIIEEMQKDSGIQFSVLRADGGASMNNLLMQIQANLLDTKVVRPKTTETTALGIAFLAGLACGFWESKEAIRDLWVLDKEFHPQQSEKNDKMLLLWRKRMAHTLNNGS
jgi:glycerol kinase